jgi:UMF1 family MFS transporter
MVENVNSKQKKRAQWAWYLYDFGNSAYAAVVLLAVYAAYFKQSVVGTAEGSALWGLSLTISMLVVAVHFYAGSRCDLAIPRCPG